jgi:hypothetical protein
MNKIVRPKDYDYDPFEDGDDNESTDEPSIDPDFQYFDEEQQDTINEQQKGDTL